MLGHDLAAVNDQERRRLGLLQQLSERLHLRVALDRGSGPWIECDGKIARRRRSGNRTRRETENVLEASVAIDEDAIDVR